jgi:hypothetical protein
MKIALLVVLGLVLGILGGAALGISAGIVWTELFQAATSQDNTGILVFFTFMPLGAMIGAVGGAVLFGMIALRDSEIQIEREPASGGET